MPLKALFLVSTVLFSSFCTRIKDKKYSMAINCTCRFIAEIMFCLIPQILRLLKRGVVRLNACDDS